MRKTVRVLLLCLALCAIVVAADGGSVTCTDSDGEKDPENAIGEKGSVTYGLTEKFDECVSGKDGYHLDTSSWVREYYCVNVSDLIQRKYEDYDCTRYEYTKCEGGKCIGKAAGTNATKAAKPAGPKCGNKVIDSGEQCDPPDKVCYDANSKIGLCTKPNAQGFGGCQCKIYKGEETTPETTPNVTLPATPPPVTPPPANVTPPPAPPAVQPPAPAAPPAETPEERAPLPTENLDDSNGIGITRGITNSVKRFFRWIGSWFG